MKPNSEEAECLTFVDWLNLKGLKFTHIGNESGYKDKKLAWIMQGKKNRMGMSKGVPDYMIITPRGLVFVEMKRKGPSSTSPEQKAWIEALNQIKGVQAQVCKGFDSAVEFVTQFL